MLFLPGSPPSILLSLAFTEIELKIFTVCSHHPLTSNKVLTFTTLCLKFFVYTPFTWNKKLYYFHKQISDKKNTTLWFSSRRQSITIYGINKIAYSIDLPTVPYFYWIAESKGNKYFRKKRIIEKEYWERNPRNLVAISLKPFLLFIF